MQYITNAVAVQQLLSTTLSNSRHCCLKKVTKHPHQRWRSWGKAALKMNVSMNHSHHHCLLKDLKIYCTLLFIFETERGETIHPVLSLRGNSFTFIGHQTRERVPCRSFAWWDRGAARESSGRENVLNNVQQNGRAAEGLKGNSLHISRRVSANKICKGCKPEGKLPTARC